MLLQEIKDLNGQLESLKLQMRDTSISVALMNELQSKQREMEKELFCLGMQAVLKLIRFEEENPELLRSLIIPHSLSGYGVREVKVSENKQAVKVLISKRLEFDDHNIMYLVPFDFFENIEAYKARRAEYVSAKKVQRLQDKKASIAEQIEALLEKQKSANDELAAQEAEHTSNYGSFSPEVKEKLKFSAVSA